MPLPADLATITVTGTYVDFRGNPVNGDVQFTPATTLADPGGDVIVAAVPIVRSLDGAGHFEVELPVTDDAEATPTGFTYEVWERFEGGRRYAIELPAALGSEVDLADLSPAVEMPGVVTYVTPAQLSGYLDGALDDVWGGLFVVASRFRGDGVSDTEALDAAFAAARANVVAGEGPTTVLLSGVWDLDDAVTESFEVDGYADEQSYRVAVRDGVGILGLPGATLRAAPYAMPYHGEVAILGAAPGTDDWFVEGVSFDGGTGVFPLTESGDHAIIVAACARWEVRNCRFFNLRGKAVNSLGETAGAGRTSSDYRFLYNRVYDIGGNAFGYNGPNDDGEIAHNIVRNNVNDDAGAEAFLGGGVATRLDIHSNHVDDFGNIGVFESVDCHVHHNYVKLPAASLSAAIGLNGDSSGGVVEANTIDMTLVTTGGVPGVFLYNGEMTGCAARGNHVIRRDGNGGAAVVVTATGTGFDVSGNTSYGGTTSGEPSYKIDGPGSFRFDDNTSVGADRAVLTNGGTASVNGGYYEGYSIYQSGGALSGGVYKQTVDGNVGPLRLYGTTVMTATGPHVYARSTDGITPAVEFANVKHVVVGAVVEQFNAGQAWFGRANADGNGRIRGCMLLGAGGTLPSWLDRFDTEAVNVVAAAGAAQVIPDPEAFTISALTLTAANCVLTFPAPVLGRAFTIRLKQDGAGGRLATWPATARWPAGVAPALSAGAGAVDYVSALCADGATYDCFVGGLDFR